MIKNPEYSHILCWASDGKMFTIVDSNLLIQ
jgi:hypothetical protein